MGDYTKQICRLCLERTPACESETIDDTKKKVLEVLMINIDFDISDYAVACTRCMKTVQCCFDFRSQCINILMDVDFKVDINDVFQKDTMSKGNICMDYSQSCRMCKCLVENNASNNTDRKDGDCLRDMIRDCVPEMDSNTIHDPLICVPCLSSIHIYYEFMKTCLAVEGRIKHYYREAGQNRRIFLKDMLGFEVCNGLDKATTVKRECSVVETSDIKEVNCPKSEEILSIKCDEIDIKDELDRVAMSQSVQFGDRNSSWKNNCLDNKTEMNSSSSKAGHTLKSKDKRPEMEMQNCPPCLSETKYKRMTPGHQFSQKKRLKCDKCGYDTNYKSHMDRHTTRHHLPKAEKKLFKCEKCPYETDEKYNLVRHILKHKDKSKVAMHKCSVCPYESRYKKDVMRHQLTHKKPEEIPMYQCEQCEYRAKYKNSMDRHILNHKDESEVEMHKCHKCTFQTKYKDNLVGHMMTHADSEMQNKLKCNKCSYETDIKRYLKQHMLKHKDKSEVQIFKCPLCPYETKYRSVLLRHQPTHNKPAKSLMYQCDMCEYQGKYKKNLTQHLLKHKDALQVEMYKCEKCELQTKYKSSLVKHMLTHEDPEAADKLKCAKCPYWATELTALKRHMNRIHSSSYADL